MKTAARWLAGLLVAVVLTPQPSARGEETKVTAGPTAILVTMQEHSPGSESTPVAGGESDPIVSSQEVPACDLRGTVTCDGPATCQDGQPMMTTIYVTLSGNEFDGGNNCPVEAAPPESGPELTPGLVAAAFQELPLPGAELVVQPPGGRTLVNFETNFYTERGELTRAVSLLGRRVELRIWPAEFRWRYGDGASERTTEPGAAHPALDITHVYRRAGRVRPSVDVTYAAEFRVGGGAWRKVQGSVTVAGEPQDLRVVEARPALVGY